MKPQPQLTVRLRLRWWFLPYLNTLSLLCEVFDAEPDLDKVQAMMKQAVMTEAMISGRWRRI